MRLTIALLALPLAACVGGMDPVVSGYNGNTVTLQVPGLSIPPSAAPDEQALAASTCGGTAAYASSRMVSDSRVEMLFICR
jgi:hypothetical protein